MRMMFICVLLLYSFTGYNQPTDYSFSPLSQKKEKQPVGWLYGSFGWHRIWYTRSSIHFIDNKTSNYDFSLIKAKGIDDDDLNIGQGIDAPQWSLRFGYLLNKKNGWGVELSYDHAKYILEQGQRVRLKGNIYGQSFDKDTIISPDFIEYEHTDGANYYMLNIVKRKILYTSAKMHVLDLLVKAGAGPVIPRTESKIMGNHYNEHYHISGFVGGVESSLRYELFKKIFTELSVKGVYARYNDVLLWGDGRASQHWWSLQALFTLAYQLPLNKKNSTH